MTQTALSAKDLFLAALELPQDARPAWLDEACADSAALRRQVEALLRMHDEPDSLLDQPRIELGLGEASFVTSQFAPTVSSRPIAETSGTVIGPYKLLEQIGEGGFGVVFMAEQTEPVKRKVALKVIKPGMDTREVVARFEAERQALALMDHMNIARVLDAGTTDAGRPYFVMDLVKGVPITEFCDKQHISVPQRLELMIAVCEAVQHAHQKGIIHRDIKPSNILVADYDGRPVPKIIDFGVAKAIAYRLTDKTVFTQHGQIVGTLEYMSPEQARFNQLEVDTRSDIYSLGVVLYELLAGDTPFDKVRLRSAALDEILRMIGEEEPVWPSARLSTSGSLPSIAANRSLEPKRLTGLVSGELDWIVMKCLEKQRDKRYGSAEQVANECRRFLAGEPIQARAITSRRRRWRWYCRNVAHVAGAYTVFTFAIMGIMYVALFGIIQFLIRGHNVHEVLTGLGPTAVTLFLCFVGAETGVATFRDKPRGAWMSLIAFALFTLGQCWALYWAIAISREISTLPIYSIQSWHADTPDGRSAFIRNCVIGYALLGLTWAFAGLVLQAHALWARTADRSLYSRILR